MKKTKALAYSELSIAINNWLLGKHLLTAEQYLGLVFYKEIHINRASFKEEEILSGPSSKAYQSLRDNGKLQLFDFDLKSEYFKERFRVLEQSQTFHDPDHQFQNDLASLIYCDINGIPVAFDYDDFFNHEGVREGYNFFSNLARAYTEHDDFVEKRHESGIVDFSGRTEFLLLFNICIDVPQIISGNTKKIIAKKLELEATYDMFDPEFRQSFDQFVCGNLPHKNYVDVSPAEFIRLKENSEYQVIRGKYQQLQKEITSKEKLIEFQKEQKDKPTPPIGSPPEWNVQDVRLNHLKYRTHEIPREHRYGNQQIISNKRIRNNSNWLFTVLHLQPTLDSVINGSTI